ncbi:MAG: hypothetical protein COU11_00365 [Candidatus Harrisonbacteria bacterium CG10_big_fil_rev_8_21_14_0_10_49_15]|uniref:EfeO-type cupredoxin-like domain-containing protein n=1 Tax=Candidatus Harrisonbacteria bacterium CG10_big_fil_rev_8_21_14_0_10_49_15 TaxID=1974587 RepID=A0A2H0UM21_9BACT|nr:MAG: hypothetical protein COU11_00365 [Candidatus Harrisonbacteria bacterium CG10_big_fil_rev_8_21_14_0_10_49_15]
MNKGIIWLIIIVIIIAGAWMLMSGSPADLAINEQAEEVVDNSMPAEESDADEVVVAREVTITASNFKFDMSEISVKKGEAVKLTLVVAEGTHDFQIDGYDAGTKILKSGETETITFTADKAGEFEFYCSVGSHRQMGMVGKLIVTE